MILLSIAALYLKLISPPKKRLRSPNKIYQRRTVAAAPCSYTQATASLRSFSILHGLWFEP